MAVTRRAFLQGGALFLAGTASGSAWDSVREGKTVAKVGLVTDIHHADKTEAGVRCYRQALPKLREALKLQSRESLDCIVHLGDLVDSAQDRDEEEGAIQTVANEFREFGKPYHLIMGNHCLNAVSKRRYHELTSSGGHIEHFDLNGVRFLCMDSCYRADSVPYDKGNFHWQDSAIPFYQLSWLRRALRDAPGPCVVLVHHLLEPLPGYCVANHEEVRSILSRSGNVVAVLQGHQHQNRFTLVDRVPYITLRSIIEGPEIGDQGSSVLSVFADGSASLKGFALQRSYPLPKRVLGA